MIETYKKNFEFIKRNNIKIGDVVTEVGRLGERVREVHSIHSMYGWICDKHSQINIDEITKINGLGVLR